MIEEIFAKAFVTRIANSLFDVVFGRKESQIESNEESMEKNKLKILIEQKIEEEVKNLKNDENEIKLLDAIRSSFVYRIHNIFKIYDIRIEEVPIFLKKFNVTNKDILYEENLLEKFDKDIIDFISETLDINSNWIYGREKSMIQINSHGYYKNSTFFCKKVLDTFPLNIYIMTERIPDKYIDEKNDDNSIYIILEYGKITLNNRTISTYKIYDDTCRYGYWRCRYELKRFILGLKKAKKTNLLYGKVIPNLSSKIYRFSEGKLSFRDLLNSSQTWYPEDYVDLPEENSCAKINEVDEIKQIINEYDKIQNY